MAKKTAFAQRLYLQGWDLSGDVGAINSAAAARGMQDVTGINVTAFDRLLTNSSGQLGFTSFWNDETDHATASTFKVLSALPATDGLAMYLLGTTAGDPVLCLSAKQINYDPTRGQDGSMTLGVDMQSSAGFPLEPARLLKLKGQHNSAADETGILSEAAGASTPSGGVGFLQHFSAATGTVEYDIEDSANSTNGVDGAWGNLLAFTDVATPYARTAQRVEVAGTVEKYVRASTNGTFTNAVLAMAFRRKLATDYDAAP